MNRRSFLINGSLLASGYGIMETMPAWAATRLPYKQQAGITAAEIYRLFKDPDAFYRPFVRWWWNGDKIEKEELARELRLMKAAGIGGVEINPIKFPARTNDMGKRAIPWLSPEWIDLLQFALKEAESIGLSCDLIVGSGWPFGAEYLRGEERSQVVLIGTHKLEGPLDYEVSLFDLFKEADPAVTSPFAGRRMEMLSVQLVPAKFNSMDQVQDLSAQIREGGITVSIPPGTYVLYGLVKVSGSMEVINGAPGANGPVLNHYNEAAVKKYLNHMSGAIQDRIGPLAGRVRAFFTDSMELEGSNWCADMPAEFKKRRGYDLMPWLPFTMFKTGGMGNTYDFNYGAGLGDEMRDKIERVRYDFELTKSELIRERFVEPFTDWCRENKVKSRMQAYGRGYFPLEGSFHPDLPECETWIKYGLGKEMSETDYRVGRAYTMINKYVSSAAHLNGKRHISCEELTNTDMVFNETLEILKVAGDQSAVSGVTHPVFHGFNYSPPDAPFPGWVRYGSFFNERNTWWPYFRLFTDYKARYSALLQQGDMFADIALLAPVADMWSIYGAQNEPFPSLIYPTWQTFIWESIHQNGSGCDYISGEVIRQSEIKGGHLLYGTRKYHTIFLIKVERMEPATAEKLFNFVATGGRIFCIDSIPVKSVGFSGYIARDIEVQGWVNKMKAFPDRFILLKKPETNFLQWYTAIQQKYKITPYVSIANPNPFITQVRYQAEAMEWLLLINSNTANAYTLNVSFSKEMETGRQTWIWDAETGDRGRLEKDATGQIMLELGPADSRLLVFDREKKGPAWKHVPAGNPEGITLAGPYSVTLQHIDGSVKTTVMDNLKDLKDTTDFVHFAGTAIYQARLQVANMDRLQWLNTGQVAGVCELTINGKSAGTKWYGRRIYPLTGLLQAGENTIEIKVVTVMGNYLKSLKDNAVAQYWTNEKEKNQPLQPMGLVGPVTLY